MNPRKTLTIAISFLCAFATFAADLYPRIGYQGILITDIIGAVDLTPENPTGPASIAGMAVDESGWVLEVYINNLSTGGAYAYGFDTNNEVTAGVKLAMNLTSQGFTDAGAATTTTRTLYGTKSIRKPYPDMETQDESIVGDTVKIRLSLSDYVYSGDTGLSATALEGLYVQGGTNSLAAAGVTVTNRSALPYPKPIANWAWRGFRAYSTNESMPLEVFAGSHFATNGKPVACVKFITKDAGDAWTTNTVTQMVLSTNAADAIQGPLYRVVLDTSGMASGPVECNAIVYPWIGDAVLSTFDQTIQEPTLYFTTLKNMVNYPRVRAIVDAVDGSDTTGRAADEVYWATNQSPPAFLTIGKALTFLSNTNNVNYARGVQPGGGIIYLKTNAAHTYFGSSFFITSNALTECVIQPEIGAPAWSAAITNYFSDNRGKDDGDIWRFYRLQIGPAGTNTMVLYHKQAWFEECQISWSSATMITEGGNTTANCDRTWIVTGSSISNLTQGLAPYSTTDNALSLTRGNLIGPGISVVRLGTVLFNSRTTDATNDITIADGINGMNQEKGIPYIMAFNKFSNIRGGNPLQLGSYYGITNGALVANNLFEYTGTNSVAQANQIHITDTLNYTNVLFAENTFTGTRSLLWYNATGTNAAWRVGCVIARTVTDMFAIKSDDIAPNDGARIGNWSADWGAGYNGNFLGVYEGMNSTTAFLNEYPGINSLQPTELVGDSFYRYVSRGTNGVTGDYRFYSDSPVVTNMVTSNFHYPWDLAGVARTNSSPPGAYVELVTP